MNFVIAYLIAGNWMLLGWLGIAYFWFKELGPIESYAEGYDLIKCMMISGSFLGPFSFLFNLIRE